MNSTADPEAPHLFPGTGRARSLRRHQTPAEQALWALLRNRKLIGLKFKRQFEIDRYVADFYCHDRRLVVELDGEVHELAEQQNHDQNRDTYLRSRGLRVLRIANREVFEDPQEVVHRIRRAAAEPLG
jgi:very-short-patch-repair endonuclease